MQQTQVRPIHVGAMLLLALTWGSSFILMKRGLKDDLNQPVLAPEQVAALRMGIASLVLLPVSVRAFRKIKIEDWKYLAVVGLVGSGIPAVLFTTAQQKLDSSVAGILNTLTPLFTLLIGAAVFRKNVIPRQFIGVFIALAGAVCLIALRGISNTENWGFSILIIIATLFYGISVNTISSKIPHIHPLHITALSLLMAGIPWTIYLLNTNISSIITDHPHGLTSIGYITILAVFGTCMANMLYFWLTQQTGPMFASSVTYLMPLVAVIWGLGDGESFGWMHLGCAAIVLAGVWLVNKK
jgi:drug/metabolite transporter (DMT)-like permease